MANRLLWSGTTDRWALEIASACDSALVTWNQHVEPEAADVAVVQVPERAGDVPDWIGTRRAAHAAPGLTIALFHPGVSSASALARLAGRMVLDVLEGPPPLLASILVNRIRAYRSAPDFVAAIASLRHRLPVYLIRQLTPLGRTGEPVRSVAGWARLLRTTPRALRGTLARRGLPSPKWVLSWYRCAFALFLMHCGWPLSTAASRSGYESPTALRRSFRRLVGEPLSEIARRGDRLFPDTALVAWTRRPDAQQP